MHGKVVVLGVATGVVANAWFWREGWTRPVLLVYTKRLFFRNGRVFGRQQTLSQLRCRRHLKCFILCFSGVKMTIFSLPFVVLLSRLARKTT